MLPSVSPRVQQVGVEGGNAPTHYVLINAVTSPATRWLLIRSYSRYSPQTWRWTIWRNTNARPARPVTYARISSGHRVGRTNQAVHIISKMSKYIGRQRESTEGNRRNGGAIGTNLYTGRPRVRMRIPWNGLTVSSHAASFGRRGGLYTGRSRAYAHRASVLRCRHAASTARAASHGRGVRPRGGPPSIPRAG